MDKNIYFAYNLPLQVVPVYENDDEDTGKITGTKILNYMPRRERCEWMDLDETYDDVNRKDFFENTAKHLENLARLMRIAGKDKRFRVYYHDDDAVNHET